MADDEVPTITISIAQVEDHYRILWLKRVSGFNPKYHCVRSLSGSYSTVLPGQGKREANVLYTGAEVATGFDFLYLCGVHKSFELDLNLHCPMRYSEGGIVKVEDDGVVATFINAERLAVPPLPESFTLTDDETFTRCRNYQFAYNAYTDPGFVVLADSPEERIADWVEQSRREQSTQTTLFGA